MLFQNMYAYKEFLPHFVHSNLFLKTSFFLVNAYMLFQNMYAYKDFVTESNEELMMFFVDAYFSYEPLKNLL